MTGLALIDIGQSHRAVDATRRKTGLMRIDGVVAGTALRRFADSRDRFEIGAVTSFGGAGTGSVGYGILPVSYFSLNRKYPSFGMRVGGVAGETGGVGAGAPLIIRTMALLTFGRCVGKGIVSVPLKCIPTQRRFQFVRIRRMTRKAIPSPFIGSQISAVAKLAFRQISPQLGLHDPAVAAFKPDPSHRFGVRKIGMTRKTILAAERRQKILPVTGLASIRSQVVGRLSVQHDPVVRMLRQSMTCRAGHFGKTSAQIGPVALRGARGLARGGRKSTMDLSFGPSVGVGIIGVALKTAHVGQAPLQIRTMTRHAQSPFFFFSLLTMIFRLRPSRRMGSDAVTFDTRHSREPPVHVGAVTLRGTRFCACESGLCGMIFLFYPFRGMGIKGMAGKTAGDFLGIGLFNRMTSDASDGPISEDRFSMNRRLFPVFGVGEHNRLFFPFFRPGVGELRRLGCGTHGDRYARTQKNQKQSQKLFLHTSTLSKSASQWTEFRTERIKKSNSGRGVSLNNLKE